MLANFSLSAKLLKRELRSGDWIILFLALLISTAVVTSLDFYTGRIQAGIETQSSRLLGGDLAVISPTAIPSEWKEAAVKFNLRHAEVWSYPSVARAGTEFQLVNVQAVSNEYPLMGETSLRPQQNTLWVEPRLLPLLQITKNDRITIGSKTFSISRELTPDIDMLNTGLIMAPRVLMRLDDVAATGTVLPGSRVSYRLLLAGSKSAINEFRLWVTPRMRAGQQLVTVRDQQTVVKNTLQNAENFLQLVMLVCLVMSGVAIALSIYQYMRRHYQQVALWRCLGIPQSRLKGILIWQLIIIAFTAGLCGIGVGYLVQMGISQIVAAFFPYPLPPVGILPVLKGFATSTLLLFAFSYPLINDLPNTSPLYLWRDDIIRKTSGTVLYWVVIFGGIGLLLYTIITITLLTLFFIDIILLGIALLYLINIGLLAITKRIADRTNGAVKRGLSQLTQYPDLSNLQFSGFSLILICIFLLSFTRTSLLQNWQQSLPPDTPNYFVINISPSDVPDLRRYFNENNVAIADIYPMIRGRMSKLNDKPILQAVAPQARGHNALHRELNLSWMNQYPSDNAIVAGENWTSADAGKGFASVENSMAEQLNLQLGDKLTFQIGEQEVSATIVNFRTVDWTSFHPNFYVIFPPGLLDGLPTTYITSFHLNSDKTAFLNGLIQLFPNLTVIDVASLLAQVQQIVANIGIAIQYLFLFSLAAGVLIVIVSFQTSLDERRRTWKLLRILGASKQYIRNSIIVEFVYLFTLILGVSFGLSLVFMLFLERLL